MLNISQDYNQGVGRAVFSFEGLTGEGSISKFIQLAAEFICCDTVTESIYPAFLLAVGWMPLSLILEAAHRFMPCSPHVRAGFFKASVGASLCSLLEWSLL